MCSGSIIINVKRKQEVSTAPLDRIYMISNSSVLLLIRNSSAVFFPLSV